MKKDNAQTEEHILFATGLCEYADVMSAREHGEKIVDAF